MQRSTGHTLSPAGPASIKLFIRCKRQKFSAYPQSFTLCDPNPLLCQGDCDIVQQLVKVCNVEAPDDLKITPLFVAAQYGRVQCLRILIDAGNFFFRE